MLVNFRLFKRPFLKKSQIRAFLGLLIIVIFVFAQSLPTYATNHSWVFDNFGDYIYSDSEIEIAFGAAKLKTASGWFDPAWPLRKQITINHTEVSGDLSNFPVLVSISADSDLSVALADGRDIVFADSLGNSLAYEIEYFDRGSGDLYAWVNLPNISDSEDTEFYMYYGNPAAEDSQSSDVWDEHFAAVWHMSDSLSTSPVVRFGYINDVEYADIESTGSEHYADSAERLADFVSEMNENYFPDFVISNSDHIQGHTSEAVTLSELEFLENIFSELDAPRYHVLGNHELSHLSKALFIEHTAMEEEYYSFDLNGWHFVVLDYTYNLDGTPYDYNNFNWVNAIVPQEQLDWLATDLANTNFPTVVFIGKDIGAALNHRGDLTGVTISSVMVNNSEEIRAVLEEAGNVHLVLVPEAGINAHNRINGIPYVMGWGFNKGAYTGENLHYAKIELYADGSIDIIGEGNQDSYWLPINESTGNNNSAIFFARDTDKDVSGKVAGAINLDGVDDMMIIPSSESLEISDEITLEAWVNIDVFNQTINTNGIILGKRPNLTNSVVDPFRNYALMLNGTTGQPRFSLATGAVGSAVTIINNQALPTGVWVHLAATFDGTTMRIYRNGVSVVSGVGFSGNSIGTSAADLTMGRYNASGSYLNDRLSGSIDEARISNIARSADWIAASYANQNSPDDFLSVGTEEKGFSTNIPTIEPISDMSISFVSISGFGEITEKNGGEIKYQISNDAGNVWYWWDGDSWIVTESDYDESNTASEINSEIAEFPTGLGEFLFKAFLFSDGTQEVILEEVDIDYSMDTENPEVSITAPLHGAIVSGDSVLLSADADDDIGITGVQFTVNGENYGEVDLVYPYEILWDSTAVIDGEHAVTAIAYDAAGNFTESESVTLVVDNMPPVRSAGNPSGPLPHGIGQTTIFLSTNEDAVCEYDVISGQNFGGMVLFSTTGGKNHSATVSDLVDDTSYTYYVKCQDGQGNTNTDDYEISFNILADTDAPEIYSISAAPEENSAIIYWTTNDAVISYVKYGFTDSYEYRTDDKSSLPGEVSSSVELEDLLTCTTYYYRVFAVDQAENESQSLGLTFKTTGCPEAVLSNPTTNRASGFRSTAVTTFTPVSLYSEFVNLILENREIFFQAEFLGIVLPQYISDLIGTPQNETVIRDLEFGMEGEDVAALQKLLIAEDYSIPAGDTGYFGGQTQSALAAYQSANNISPAIGYFGPVTRTQMKVAELSGIWW